MINNRRMPQKKTSRAKPPLPKEPATKIARSGIHGRGLFAAEPIKKGDWIGTYEGPRTMRDGKYVLWIYEDDDSYYGIAGKNHMRFINHSKRPNAIFYGSECYALKKIAVGEEICFDYGEEWNDLE